MTYKIVTSGKIKVVTLAEISRNLKVQSDVFILSDKEIYLGPVSHKTLVFFITEFADYALKNYTKKNIPEADICISLAKKWLQDNTSVSNEELIAADADAIAYAAYAVYAAAAEDPYAAADAAYAADAAANAAAAAVYAVYAAAAVYDADAYAYAANAAAAAAYAAVVDRDKEFLRQGEFILDFLKTGNNLFML